MIKRVEKYAKKIMAGIPAHDFKHVDRVRNWILLIAKREGYRDLEVAEIAALLHDIGYSRPRPKRKRGHGEEGAEMAEKFLKKNKICSEKKIREICNAIRFHNSNRKGSGELLYLLRDADMLDMFGAVGIMRAFVFSNSKPEYDEKNVKGETWGMTRNDFDERLDGTVKIGKFIVDYLNFHISCYGNLKTRTAKRIARPMVKYTQKYILQLEKEILRKI